MIATFEIGLNFDDVNTKTSREILPAQTNYLFILETSEIITKNHKNLSAAETERRVLKGQFRLDVFIFAVINKISLD